MCERQDENAMKNKFQFNWTATKVQVCKDLRNGGLEVVFSVQWETYCRLINVSDYKMIETRLSQNLKRTAPRPFVVVMAKFDSVKDVWLPTPALLIWRKIQISAEQACTMEKWQWRDMSMSEDGNPVCTYSGANSRKKVRVCDYEYWIKWARLLSPMHNENSECKENKFQFNWTATKVQVCKDLKNGGLEVVFSVQWETFCRRIIPLAISSTEWGGWGAYMASFYGKCWP